MDAYVDAAFRMQRSLAAPSRTIVGNWVHGLPSSATPGPNLDELHEMVRFFDRWLKGIENGADAEPAITWFEREYAEPEPFPETLPGRWRAASAYPHPAVERRDWVFAGGALPLAGRLKEVPVGAAATTAGEDRDAPVSTDTGTDRPSGRALPCRGEPAGRRTGSHATCARTRRSARPTPPRRSMTRSRSSACPRCCSTCRRPARSRPWSSASPTWRPTAPRPRSAPGSSISPIACRTITRDRWSRDESTTIRVELRPAGYRFLPGHRIRVSVASSAWPVTWPSPYATDFELHHGPATPSGLTLPVIPPAGGPGDVPVPAFKTTPPDAPEVGGEGGADQPVWHITEDVIAGSVTVTVHDGGEDVLDDGRRLYAAETLVMTASDADPAHATLDADVIYRWQDHDFQTEIRARSIQTSDAAAFDLTVDLEVDVDGEPFFRRTWHEVIERRLV